MIASHKRLVTMNVEQGVLHRIPETCHYFAESLPMP
jgi:hypothetical protein